MNRKYWIRISVMAFIVVVLLAVGVVQGQKIARGSTEPDGEGDMGGASADMILAQPPQTINYQGYLTDGDGSPLNGTHDMVFTLYDRDTAGTAEWGPETHSAVQVDDGLFQVALGVTVPLRPDDFDEALYLAVTVDGVDISPRQPLRAVPYAFGLVPGAEVEGDPDTARYALRVENTGSGVGDTGLYATGNLYGLSAHSTGGDIGIYSPDYVKARGYQSTEDSYVWVPALAGVLLDTSCTTQNSVAGYLTVFCPTGTSSYHFPLVVPAVMYGQNVFLESVEIYYEATPTSYIDYTNVYKITSANTHDVVLYSTEDQDSTTATFYEVLASGDIELTADSGALTLHLGLVMTTPSGLDIGAVRVRLRHDPAP